MGAEKVLAMLKRGHKTFWGSFNTGALSFSHTERWMQKVSTLKKKRGGGGGENLFPVLKGGGKKFRTFHCPIWRPSSPNDRSLIINNHFLEDQGLPEEVLEYKKNTCCTCTEGHFVTSVN